MKKQGFTFSRDKMVPFYADSGPDISEITYHNTELNL